MRFDGALAPLHPVGAVAAVEVFGLEVGRRRQNNVGVARGVIQERIVDHGEEILAAEAFDHLMDLGAGDGGIVGGDIKRPQRRVLHV